MSEVLYSQVQKVHYKSPETEDRPRFIRITVEVQTTTTPIHRKDLIVRLTDNDDPFFLYSLCLGEEDFQTLKAQQGLLVDFAAFPQKFIALLKFCAGEETNEVPKFLLNFVATGLRNSLTSCNGQLAIVETNPFKHLTHLTLQFAPGNDSDVKKYLATCLKTISEEKEKLQSRLKFTEEDLNRKLSEVNHKFSSTMKELEALRMSAAGQTEKLTTIHAQDINSEREKALKLHSELQQRFDSEKRELETTLQQSIRQLETKLKDSEVLNKELTDRRYRGEATIRELKAKLATYEEELHRLRDDLQRSRKDNNELHSQRHNQDKNIQQLRTRLAVLEQELLDKEQLLSRVTTSADNAHEQRSEQEQRLRDQNNEIKKMENTIKTMSDELIKGNEIIKRLQTELRGYIGKVKVKNEVTTRQERVISEKESSIETIKRDLEKKNDDLKNKEEEVSTLRKQLEVTLEKLEESKDVLKTNENVINWLNKQLNDKQRGSLSNHQSIKSGPAIPNYSTPIGSSSTGLSLPSSLTPNLGASPVVRMQSVNTMANKNIPQIRYNGDNATRNVGIDSKYLTSEGQKQPLNEMAFNRQTNTMQFDRQLPIKGPKAPLVSAYFTGALPKSTG